MGVSAAANAWRLSLPNVSRERVHRVEDLQMTDAEIEAAARELCRLRGVDAEGEAGTPPHPYPPGARLLWECYAPEVRSFAQVGTAIASVMVKAKRKAKEKK